MGSSGGADVMSYEEMQQVKEQARKDAEAQVEKEQAQIKKKAQDSANSASVTTTGGLGAAGDDSTVQTKKKKGTLEGAGEATFTEKSDKLGG